MRRSARRAVGPTRRGRSSQLAFDFVRETHSEALFRWCKRSRRSSPRGKAILARPGIGRRRSDRSLPPGLMPYFYAPQLALPKILLAQATPASREQAAAAAVPAARLRHCRPQHPLHDRGAGPASPAPRCAGGRASGAGAVAASPVTLAEPGGFIRLFVDLGTTAGEPAHPVPTNRCCPGLYGPNPAGIRRSRHRLLSTPKRPFHPMDRTELVEPLSEREREVLALLAQRLTDKEIAKALTISPLTVKRHTHKYLRQTPGQRAARGGCKSDPPWPAVRPLLPPLHPSIHPFLHPQYILWEQAFRSRSDYA